MQFARFIATLGSELNDVNLFSRNVIAKINKNKINAKSNKKYPLIKVCKPFETRHDDKYVSHIKLYSLFKIKYSYKIEIFHKV